MTTCGLSITLSGLPIRSQIIEDSRQHPRDRHDDNLMKRVEKEREPQNSMEATWKLVVEEHLRRGGKLEDLKMDKTFTRKGRMEDKNKPYTR